MMSGHWPHGGAHPYSNDPEVCECGVVLDYDGDIDEQAWCAADGSDAPCPVWDEPAGGETMTDEKSTPVRACEWRPIGPCPCCGMDFGTQAHLASACERCQREDRRAGRSLR